MGTLLLTSSGLSNSTVARRFLDLCAKPAKEIKIAFVPTASRTEEELKYVHSSWQELLRLGFRSKNIYIIDLSRRVPLEVLDGVDVLYVCGGNTFFLLHKVRKSGFDKAVVGFVQRGGVYVGVSAGSIIAGSDVGIASLGPFGDVNDVNLNETTGLRLTDVVVSPHYTSDEVLAVKTFARKSNLRVVPLTDSQALLVNGDGEFIIE